MRALSLVEVRTVQDGVRYELSWPHILFLWRLAKCIYITPRAMIVIRSPLYSFTQTALLAGLHGAGG